VNFNNNAKNSINVTKTLATKHQKSLASRYPLFTFLKYKLFSNLSLLRMMIHIRIHWIHLFCFLLDGILIHLSQIWIRRFVSSLGLFMFDNLLIDLQIFIDNSDFKLL
jgi:hypothetical protein